MEVQASLLKELNELISGVRNDLDDTDNLALGLKSGDYSEEDFMQNYDSIVKSIESAGKILDEIVGDY